MKTPSFWYKPQGFSPASFALQPFASLYETVSGLHRIFSTPQKAPLPVLCLGNLTAGGSGKTPTAIALARLLQESKLFVSPAFVTRGYRGDMTGPERVDPLHGGADVWGDEALLLERSAPTIVAKDRFQGAVYARDTGADVVLLDDGLQNYSIEKDISFCVIDGMMGLGNGKVIPAGPLRQSPEDGFYGVDAVILIGEDLRDVFSLIPSGLPLFRARVEAQPPSSSGSYVAFCGIAFPEKFRKTIEESGLSLSSFHAFADHHNFSAQDLEKLVAEAGSAGARLLTTEKDFVRLPEGPCKSLTDTLPIEIVFDDSSALSAFIKGKIAP